MTDATRSAAPLSLAVVGAGAVGSAFAFHLARAGHAVTVVARPGSARLEQLRRDGAIVRTHGERATVDVAGALDEAEPYDLVVVTTLAHQVDAVLPALARSRAAAVQFMFNTFGPERLAEALGGRAAFGLPFIMARLDAEGRLDATVSAGRRTLHGDPRWAELFTAAGVPSAFQAEMPLWLRCHAPVCVAMESVCVLAQRRGGASWREAREVARGLRAGLSVARATCGRLFPGSKAALAAAPEAALAAMLWAVSRNAAFRELLAGGAPECRALIDALAAAAEGATTPLPKAAEDVRAIRPA